MTSVLSTLFSTFLKASYSCSASAHRRWGKGLAGICMVLMCCVHGTALAEKTEQELAIEATQVRINQITQELAFIQQKAVSNNPALQKQKAEYEQVIKTEIKKLGQDPDELEARLRFLSHQLGNKAIKLSDEQFKVIEKEFLEKRQLLNQIFLKASKTDSVKTAAKRFSSAMKATMKDISGNTGELEKELGELQARYKKLTAK